MSAENQAEQTKGGTRGILGGALNAGLKCPGYLWAAQPQPAAGASSDTEPRTWVKIPTLDPRAPNALVLLGEADLVKLSARANLALAKVRAMKADRNRLKRGDKVRSRYTLLSVARNTEGIVLDAPEGARSIRVAFVGVGAVYVGLDDVIKVS